MLSSSSSKQVQVSATDSGKVVYGKGRITESGSFQLGDKATYTESGGINIGAKGTLKTGPDLSNAQLKGATINFGGDTEGALNSLGTMFQNLFSGQQQQMSSLLGALVPTTTTTTATTGDAPATNKKKRLMAVGALVLGLGLIWWIFRKR